MRDTTIRRPPNMHPVVKDQNGPGPGFRGMFSMQKHHAMAAGFLPEEEEEEEGGGGSGSMRQDIKKDAMDKQRTRQEASLTALPTKPF